MEQTRQQDTATVTGNPEVDAVLESLESLDELAVSDHVAVFETAHARLRASLADGAATAAPARPLAQPVARPAHQRVPGQA